MKIEEYLVGQPFFAGLTDRDLGHFVQAARLRDCARHELLVRPGAPAREFFLVFEGEIRREIPALMGPPLVMHSLGPGEVLGWAWLIPPRRWAFVARSEAPSRVVQFDGEYLLEQCQADPRFGYQTLMRFSQLMSQRLGQARQQMMSQWSPPGIG